MNPLELQSDPAAFQQGIHVATGSGPRRFGEVMADFQRERFAAVNPSLLAVVRQEAPPIPRIWDERTKGGSKDTDWTVNLLWLLAFSQRALRMQVGAFDAEQADEIRLIVKDILRTDGPINGFLRRVIDAQADRIINQRTGSVVEILTSDKFGSHGSRIDLLLMNELTHQPSSGFAETLFDNLDKMPNAFGVIATNSGHDPSWQLEWKRVALASPRWKVFEFNRPSPWVSPEALAESEKRNPASRFRRLWWGAWTPADDTQAALSETDIAVAFRPNLRPMMRAVEGYEFVAGLDLGITRDFSGLCVLGIRRGHKGHGMLRLAFTRVWRPLGGRRIDLQEIEDTIALLHDRYDFKGLCYDPWQAVHMASRLQSGEFGRIVHGAKRRGSGVPMIEVPPTGKNLQAIATAVREAFSDQRVELYEDSDLRSDLIALRLEERSYGFRLVSPRSSATGHGDLGTAFSLATLAASNLATKPIVRAGIPESSPSPIFARFEAEQARYAAEMERLSKGGSDPFGQEEWRRAMRRVGRIGASTAVDIEPSI